MVIAKDYLLFKKPGDAGGMFKNLFLADESSFADRLIEGCRLSDVEMWITPFITIYIVKMSVELPTFQHL